MSDTTRKIVEVVLAIVIIGLGYFLYRSVRDPYREIERQQELTQLTRQRLSNLRTAMIYYNERNGRYVTSLDSLHVFLRDSLTEAERDSLYRSRNERMLPMDSLLYSPRPPHEMFRLAVNDTGRVKIYLLEDPSSQDRIGSTEPDITRLNAASWE